MKIAEAMAERAAMRTKLNDLLLRMRSAGTYQEGQSPSEDVMALLSEWKEVRRDLTALELRINRTNARIELEIGLTIADAIVHRNELSMLAMIHKQLADIGAGATTAPRWGRAELVTKTDIPVTEMRNTSDDYARLRRELDMRLQQLDWTVDLL